jgi:uncharacterized Zn finger protein
MPTRRYDGVPFFYSPYVSKAKRQEKAKKITSGLRKKGKAVTPVIIEGQTIAKSVWGKAWCNALESHADYENRLPRGRTYVRNGSVFHLAVHENRVEAQVCGSEVYKVTIEFKAFPEEKLQALKTRCSSCVTSLSDLLAGRVPPAVMEMVSEKKSGLFPAPGHMTFKCSCPDWASMCKHVAAVLYGVGARLDEEPEILFTLRGINHLELVPKLLAEKKSKKADVFADDELADVFGVDIAPVTPAKKAPSRAVPPKVKPALPSSKVSSKASQKTKSKKTSSPATKKPARNAKR